MSLDKQDVYGELLNRLESGVYPAESKLPPERSIAKELSVTLWAVHSAMNELEENGLIERRRSVGTFVKAGTPKQNMTLMKNRNSRTVGVVVSRKFFYTNWGGEDILGSLEKSFAEKNCSLSYLDFPRSEKGLAAFFAEISEAEIGALVVFPEKEEWEYLYKHAWQFQEQPFDLFIFNRGLGADDTFSCNMVSLDIKGGGYRAGNLLIEEGFKRLAFCSPDMAPNNHWFSQRFAGFSQACESRNLKPTLFITTQLETQLNRIADFVRASKDIPALVCATDATAMLLWEHLKHYELTAGKDYYLLGFDNHPAYRRDNLNTMGWPLEQAATLLASGVNEFATGTPHDHHSIKFLLKPHLITRSGPER